MKHCSGSRFFFSLFLKPNWASGSKVFLVYNFCKWIYQSFSGWHIKITIKFKMEMLPLIFTCMTHRWIFSHMTVTALHLRPAPQAFFFFFFYNDLVWGIRTFTQREGGSEMAHSLNTHHFEKKNLCLKSCFPICLNEQLQDVLA